MDARLTRGRIPNFVKEKLPQALKSQRKRMVLRGMFLKNEKRWPSTSGVPRRQVAKQWLKELLRYVLSI